jgi:hypothetical protein
VRLLERSIDTAGEGIWSGYSPYNSKIVKNAQYFEGVSQLLFEGGRQENTSG